MVKQLISHEIIINLVSNATTTSDLYDLDTNKYLKGIKILDKELEKILINRADFHED
jgi:hypothetical protein